MLCTRFSSLNLSSLTLRQIKNTYNISRPLSNIRTPNSINHNQLRVMIMSVHRFRNQELRSSYPMKFQTISRSFADRPEFSKKKSPLPFMVFSVVGLGCILVAAYTFSGYQKARIEAERKEQMEKSKPKGTKGKALIGGPFTLINTEGETVTDKDFLGQWLLIYFGFTFCPDICPEELEKIGEMVDLIESTPNAPKIQPIFISVDPKRDTPDLIKSYLADFHPKFIGLTGSVDQVKRATKSYRVYYSEGPDQAPGAMEYIVDHSIVTFLVNPDGDFCKNFGQRSTAEEAASQIADKINEFYTT